MAMDHVEQHVLNKYPADASIKFDYTLVDVNEYETNVYTQFTLNDRPKR